jgi:hypothetical protein
MSRRVGVAGLVLSGLLLLATIALISGASLPGPHVKTWLGIDPPLPDLCEYSPVKVFEPRGKPGPGHWHLEHDSPTPSPEPGAATIGRYVYLIGGQERTGTFRDVYRFDPLTGKYREEPDAPVAIDHPVVSAYRGNLILATGFADGSDPTNRAWSYSVKTRRWRELPPARVKRGAAAGVVVGHRLYIAGGITGFGNQNSPLRLLEIYDFKRERWYRGPDMPTPRHHFGVGVVGGRLYFAGGRQPSDQALGAFEEFDPGTNRWRRLPPVPTDTGSPGVTAIAGQVVVTGGGRDPIHPDEPGGWTLRTAYAYRPQTGRWRRLPDMLNARHGHVAAATDGKVFVFRGAPCPGYGEMSSVESLRLD